MVWATSHRGQRTLNPKPYHVCFHRPSLPYQFLEHPVEEVVKKPGKFPILFMTMTRITLSQDWRSKWKRTCKMTWERRLAFKEIKLKVTTTRKPYNLLSQNIRYLHLSSLTAILRLPRDRGGWTHHRGPFGKCV